MKNKKSLLAALVFLGNIMVSGAALAADGIISKTDDAPGSYCHEKFTAIEGQSLASGDPMLKSTQSGDVIDFYGSCAESPVGQDQVHEQNLELQHRRATNYED